MRIVTFIVLLAASASTAFAQSAHVASNVAEAQCPETGPSASCPTSLPPLYLGADDVASYAFEAGFRGARLVNAIAVAYAESFGVNQAFNQHAIGDHGNSFGLWQINRVAHPDEDCERLLNDPSYAACRIYEDSARGSTWRQNCVGSNGNSSYTEAATGFARVAAAKVSAAHHDFTVITGISDTVVALGSITVRDDHGGAAIGTVPAGAMGTVTNGPFVSECCDCNPPPSFSGTCSTGLCSSVPYYPYRWIWWEIDWHGAAPNGWSGEDFIDANRIRSVVTWGRNDFDLGNVPFPNTGFADVAGGYAHSLGLKTDGSIVAWGANNYGQSDVPSPNTGFVAVADGDSHSLGLKDDGSIVAWGCGPPYNYGQCDVPSPNTGFVAVKAGHSHSLGLKGDGSIVAWGANWSGQIDLPSPNADFIGVAAGYYHSLGLKVDRSIIAWGRDDEGQANVPFPNTGFVRIAAGGWHSIGLRADGSIVAWGCGGSANFGQCNVPSPNSGFVAVAAGLAYTLGLKPDGSILVWGCGDRYSPSKGTCNIPSPNLGFVAIAAGAYHGLGIKRASADFDGDGDVDLGDFAPFTEVMKGPFAAPGVSRWQIMDLDPDDDVDLRDLSVWQNAFSGPRPSGA